MNVVPNSYHDDNAAVISNDAASSTLVVRTLSAAPGKEVEKGKIDTNALQISKVSVLSRQQFPNIHTNT
jgi:hypothetical protein